MKTSLLLACFSAALACANAQAQDFSAQELKQFSQVENQVDNLRIEYIKKAFYAHDQKKAQVIAHEGEVKMTKAVEASGLNVAQYNAIAEAACEDADLRLRIASIH